MTTANFQPWNCVYIFKLPIIDLSFTLLLEYGKICFEGKDESYSRSSGISRSLSVYSHGSSHLGQGLEKTLIWALKDNAGNAVEEKREKISDSADYFFKEERNILISRKPLEYWLHF